MITYKQSIKRSPTNHTGVYLDGKLVGNIKEVPGEGFRYVPKGRKMSDGGEIYASIAAVKSTL